MFVRQIDITDLESVLLVAHIIKYQKAVKNLHNKTGEAKENRKKKKEPKNK